MRRLGAREKLKKAEAEKLKLEEMKREEAKLKKAEEDKETERQRRMAVKAKMKKELQEAEERVAKLPGLGSRGPGACAGAGHQKGRRGGLGREEDHEGRTGSGPKAGGFGGGTAGHVELFVTGFHLLS